MFNRVRTKIVLLYSTLIIVLGALFFAFFVNLVRDIHLGILQREMLEKIRFIEVLFQEKGGAYFGDRKRLQAIISQVSPVISLRITIIDLNGKVLADSYADADSLDNHLYRTEVMKSIRHGTGQSLRYSNSLKRDMLYLAKKSGNYVIRLSKNVNEIDASIAKVRRAVLLFTAAAMACAFIINFFISRIISKPINETIEFAEGFSRGDLERRIFNYGDDEIGRLQKSLNRLADTLKEKITTLILEQRKLEVTMQSINDGIAVIDHGKKILLVNKAFNSLLEVDTTPAGKYYYEVIRNSALNSRIERALAAGAPDSGEIELLNGISCDLHISPITEEKSIQGVLIVLHDITERKRIVRIKTELVGNLSHELKTPITILKGYLETIKSQMHDIDTLKGFIEKALVSVDRQNSIINDMLKLNMLETTGFFTPEEINLKEVIENCLNILAPKIEEKRLAVSADLELLDATVTANRFLAEEIFFNLIDNAINYNRFDGSIEVRAEREPSGLLIRISDTGIGIPPDSIDRVFERFYRVNKSRSRATGGTGLGLSIVKHAAELIHWSVRASSEGSGSTFTVEIPNGVRA